MRWIDTHVHMFSADENGPLLLAKNSQNTADAYFSCLNDKKPEAVVIVDFSMAETSDHVINSLDSFKEKNVPAFGIIRGNLNDTRTEEWLKRDDVKGIRLYAKDSVPDVSGEKWAGIFRILEKGKKHILVFGSSRNVAELITKIPSNIPVLIDHLGLPNIFSSEKDHDYIRLLETARKRDNVFFKGPGYRTSLDITKVKPVVNKIIANIGADRLILGASDGPFAGAVLEPAPEYAGKKFDELMDYTKVIKFVNQLAKSVANGKYADKLLYANAKKLYEF